MSITPATEDAISVAAAILRNGGLVGMPTETVYGIAADALNVDAVMATFAAKGRPSENPLIVHVASVDQARSLVSAFPDTASKLAERFWPGPLTLVLNKKSTIPSQVTGGLATVAVRVPAHPVARRLIEVSGLALSAPSANRFMALSPTSAEMISPGIARDLAMVLDGGPCEVGIESTVLDLSGDKPAILRPGDVSAGQIEDVLGMPVLGHSGEARKSPGMYARHYAPRAQVIVVDRLPENGAGLVLQSTADPMQIPMPLIAHEFAQKLYKALYDLDARGVDVIYVEAPPRTEEWSAVWDRLSKASHSEG